MSIDPLGVKSIAITNAIDQPTSAPSPIRLSPTNWAIRRRVVAPGASRTPISVLRSDTV
jgi:hypothetical protein